jgi:hypothetical protein
MLMYKFIDLYSLLLHSVPFSMSFLSMKFAFVLADYLQPLPARSISDCFSHDSKK